MDVLEAIRTTRAMRRLDPDQPVTADHLGEKDLLGIPADQQTFALIPVGHPLGRWGEAKRRPVAEVAHWDRWGNPPPG